jgi:hypothetical protein
MSAFDDGRVGLWVNNPANISARISNISSFAGGMFSDVFCPSSTSVAQAGIIKGAIRPDGTRLKFQLYEIPGPTESPQALATRVSGDIARLAPGVVEVDIEKGDSILASYIRDFVNAFRSLRPTFLLRINIAPNKGGFLPVDLIQSDPNLYACEQTYYGDMSPVSQVDVLADLEGHGVPASKDQVTYGAAITTKVPDGNGGYTWKRVLGIPTVFYQGHVVSRLKSGLVYDDDLMADMGVL